MTWLKRLLLLAVMITGLILGIWFSTENSQLVSVYVMGFSTPEISLGLLVFFVLALGTLLGYLLSVIPNLTLKSKMMSLQRKLQRRDVELERLRKAPLKG